MNDQQRRGLAEQLRTQLATVIADEADRRALAAELDHALAHTGDEADELLSRLLGSRPEVVFWVQAHDPALADPERLVELAGIATELGTYFVCPHGDFDFVRETVSDDVPVCPVHGMRLVAAND